MFLLSRQRQRSRHTTRCVHSTGAVIYGQARARYVPTLNYLLQLPSLLAMHCPSMCMQQSSKERSAQNNSVAQRPRQRCHDDASNSRCQSRTSSRYSQIRSFRPRLQWRTSVRQASDCLQRPRWSYSRRCLSRFNMPLARSLQARKPHSMPSSFQSRRWIHRSGIHSPRCCGYILVWPASFVAQRPAASQLSVHADIRISAGREKVCNLQV